MADTTMTSFFATQPKPDPKPPPSTPTGNCAEEINLETPQRRGIPLCTTPGDGVNTVAGGAAMRHQLWEEDTHLN